MAPCLQVLALQESLSSARQEAAEGGAAAAAWEAEAARLRAALSNSTARLAALEAQVADTAAARDSAAAQEAAALTVATSREQSQAAAAEAAAQLAARATEVASLESKVGQFNCWPCCHLNLTEGVEVLPTLLVSPARDRKEKPKSQAKSVCCCHFPLVAESLETS